MKQYTVLFEIYGKKLKTVIKADSMADAQAKIRQSIIFHKTTLCESDKTVDALKGIFRM